MEGCYQEILQKYLDFIADLPVEIPPEGIIAGFTVYKGSKNFSVWGNDNLHYPMGTSYLRMGVKGVAEYARKQFPKCETPRETGMLESIAQTYDAIAAYFARYLPVLDEKIAGAEGKEEKQRLSAMRENMAVLSKGAPETFAQAIQLFYLIWRLRCVNACATIGRLDQHLYPHYKADVEKGILDQEKALDLICQLWNRLNECGSGDTLMHMMMGGRNEKGEDMSNDLSLLMFRASCILGKTEPHINLRYHKKINPAVLDEALKLQLMGHGQATFYNDEFIIPALVEHGVPLEYACAYANDGCTELVFDGISDINFNHIDVVAVFELALNNGQLTPKEALPVPYFHKEHKKAIYHPDVSLGYQSGDAALAETYEEFYQLFLKQYKFQADVKFRQMLQKHEELKLAEGTPLLNGTFESVMDSRKDVMGGGLPMLSEMTFMGSIPTVADCLMAMKKVVYEKKMVDIPTLQKALAANFEGYEALRAHLLNAPKFGNDIDEVDMIAADIARHTCEWAEAFEAETGYPLRPALVGWKFLEEAYGVGATPDGRKYADPIAEHYCATPGRAKMGPTALINSISKGPLSRACGIAASHVSLPASVSGDPEEGLKTLRDICLAGMDQGVTMLNIAIYDVDTLKKAQQNPEAYQDLIVRVWGFSAKFVELSREMQDHVISRVMNM